MKICIDVSQLAYPGSGVAVYTQNLVDSLLKIDKENNYAFFFSSLRQQAPENLKVKSFKFPPLFLETLWNRLHVLPIENFMGKIDVFHSSDWLEPAAKCPKVTTIHDLAIFKYPEAFVGRGGHDIVANQKRKLEWVKKETEIIIAVSENTKKDIIELLGIKPERIKVVYEAADKIFSQQYSANSQQQVLDKYGIKGNYILAVGTREPRKNLNRVIEAFGQLKGRELQLVIAGKYGWGQDQSSSLDHQSSIKLLGYVPKEDLVALYQGAATFVYPSLYEGFGLPVLEAMVCGCPVVCSSVSSLPEVVGNAAVLVNPEESEDIAQGIKKALEKREVLIKKGKERAKDFSWDKTAKETLEIYKEVGC